MIIAAFTNSKIESQRIIVGRPERADLLGDDMFRIEFILRKLSPTINTRWHLYYVVYTYNLV